MMNNILKLANQFEYEEFVSDSTEQIQERFPNAKLRSFSDFKSFLDNLIPKLVHKYLLLSRSMKNCSGLSPDFADIACSAGFLVLTQRTPGHFRNIVLTTDGPFIVDLTYVQFICNQNDKVEMKNMFRKLYKDPFLAIKIDQHPKQWIPGCKVNHREYSEISPDPVEAINKYEIEETEETFPELFKNIR